MPEPIAEGDARDVQPSLDGLQMTDFLGADPSGLGSSCPPEYADLSSRELMTLIETARQERAGADADEVLAAGFRPRLPAGPPGLGCGFESGGVLDVSAPDGPLAGLTDAVTRDGRLSELNDDELIGVLRAWHRLASWCASGALTAIAELARRRPAERTAPAPGVFPAQLSEFVTDEVAAALTLTSRAADTQLGLALDLEIRLPGTAHALHEGIIDPPKARLIAEATRILSDEQARQVEATILPGAGTQTTGQLRAAVARAVVSVDPEAATRRREEAQKEPRVRRWQEDTGTAALAGYGLSAADVLTADQRLTARALRLRAAGLSGTVEELRARAYLDALLGRDSVPPSPGDQPPLPARVTLTVPLLTHLGLTSEPGLVAGFGPVDPALARELAARAAAHPASRFCVTVTGPDRQAIGHGCIPGRPPDLSRSGSPDLTRSGSPDLTVTVSTLADGLCDHRHQEPGYQPSRKLQHLIWARNPTCTAPGCRRPAACCDLDHTTPYDRGGRTCECNLAPLCRHHHRCKQSDGWRLDQPRPGVMVWTTVAGRRYVVPASGLSQVS